ncbi:phage tail protein [Chitinophaga sp. CF418]|uniref:phage tail protein n=1 Tax=Chitinophaga sp. CF418 TaxID=1855287 RepID=UPI00090EE186|nr:phage tail protein [Chitinophaga sp. CF418]SHN42224.1 P2-related tail formation protein [Chitinophaga sp. CF418]
MSKGSVLADSVAHLDHIRAFDLAIKKRFSQIQLDAMLVYFIDNVSSAAIPYLAQQFDVLGYKGFRLAETEQQQREIIKQSIELHRYKGTPWAIRQALVAIGFGDALLEEGVAGHWANFRITIDLGERALGNAEVDDLVKMVNEYKNARSHLIDVSYTITVGGDTVTLTDSETDAQAIEDIDIISAGGSFLHNGKVFRNGSRNYSRDTDTLTLTII